MRLERKYIFVGLLLAFVATEGLLVATARFAEFKAENLCRTLESLKFGATSVEEAETVLSNGKYHLQSELCSSASGECKGMNIHINNSPKFSFDGGRWISSVLTHISIIQTSSLDVNLYFNNDRLKSVSARLDVGQRSVGISQYLGDKHSTLRSDWKTAPGIEDVESIRSSIPAFPDGTPGALQQLNLHCMFSVKMCDSAKALWPSAPPPTI